MKSILQQIAASNRQMELVEAKANQNELDNPVTSPNRRNFLKKTALGGIALGGLMSLPVEETIAQTTSKVSRASKPSELKITDMRYALTAVMGGTAIIRIDTNQGIYGLGEVRDGADVRYALMLKSRILGLNPCNVEMILRLSNSLAVRHVRPEVFVQLRWHCGICAGRHMVCQPGNCLEAGIGKKYGCMLILPNRVIPKNNLSG